MDPFSELEELLTDLLPIPAGWRVAKTKEVDMSDRATIKALCKKYGWIFAEEDAPDDPRWREGSRIYFPGSSMQPATSSSENENDSRENQ